jgi:ribonuclease D
MRAIQVPDHGTPPVVEDSEALNKSIAEIAQGHGPIAIDAERASGFRYSARAYLIQIFRRGGGLHLIDPIAINADKSSPAAIAALNELIAPEEVVIHASTQDLPCLREFGINPQRLFDTELGARIAGCPRVGLGSLCESLLEVSLAKEHSAVDWSIRPLQQEWLDYAALDVEVLIDLRDKVAELLAAQGKSDWALQDFAAILDAPPSTPRKEPWRRTSGMHTIKSRYHMAIVRELWNERDRIASEIDLAPGRLLSDTVISAMAQTRLKSVEEFLKLPESKTRIRNEVQKSYVNVWFETYLRATSLPEKDWPQLRSKSDSLPPVKIWRAKFPLAYARIMHARLKLNEIATSLEMPLENLLTPEVARKITFDNANEKRYDLSQSLLTKVETQLRLNGAREWQIEKCSRALAESLCESEPPELPEEPANEGEGGATPSEE